MSEWIRAEVVENQQWDDGLHSLRFAAQLPAFAPGQFARVGLDVDGERIARPYSLVNSPGEGVTEIYFNEVADGPLSPRLAALRPGDELWVNERITGFLTIDEVPDARHLWLLATGTGVGPFVAILKDDRTRERFERVILVHSVRTAAELGYREHLQRLCEQYADHLRYLPAVTREQVPGALTERIPHAIASGSLEQAAGLDITPEDAHVMLCGSSAMITDTTDLLKQRGLQRHLRRKPGHITLEKYH